MTFVQIELQKQYFNKLQRKYIRSKKEKKKNNQSFITKRF